MTGLPYFAFNCQCYYGFSFSWTLVLGGNILVLRFRLEFLLVRWVEREMRLLEPVGVLYLFWRLEIVTGNTTGQNLRGALI